MGRLHKLASGLPFISCYFAFGLSAVLAQDVCSLTVRVLSPDGRRPEAPIEVQERNGRVQRKFQEPGKGDVQFCDLGILPVTVSVGGEGDACNRVTIHNVPVSLERAYLLKVTYDPEACDIWHGAPPPVPLCKLLFRVADSTGTWVPGARLEVLGEELKADRYGRALFVAERGEKILGTVTAEGFGPAELSFTCSDQWQEHLIQLEKR